MSLNGAMNTAVSALKAQGQALSMVSTNLANSSTVGYKSTHARFATLVTEMASGTAFAGGGVTSSARQNVSAQGLIEPSSNSTDIAIDGNGMFVVATRPGGGSHYYTRNGEFDTDEDGYLVANGYYLMGWATDAAGNVANPDDATLQVININARNQSAKATTEIGLDSNLPSTAAVGDTYTATLEVIDSLGNSHSLTATYEKTGDNTWELSVSDPWLSSDTGTPPTSSGTSATTVITLNFTDEGVLDTTVPDPATLSITGWTTAAADSSISLDLASLSQLSDDYDVGTISQDGFATGDLESLSVDSDGTIFAIYDNGQSMPIYKIAVATFANYNGLTAMSDNVYAESGDSGIPNLCVAGSDGAGEIRGNAVEASNVDTADEFTRMIVAQQAYSAASQIISTVQDMYDDLMAAVR